MIFFDITFNLIALPIPEKNAVYYEKTERRAKSDPDNEPEWIRLCS